MTTKLVHSLYDIIDVYSTTSFKLLMKGDAWYGAL